MDFVSIQVKERKRDGQTIIEVGPDFKVIRSKDLMVRGKAFYAIWDEEAGLWSTDEYLVPILIDRKVRDYINNNPSLNNQGLVVQQKVSDYSSNAWKSFKHYVSLLSDSAIAMDNYITFENSVVRKDDYASKRVPYSLEEGEPKAFNELMSVLYAPEEREKIEWAMGAILSGDGKDIQKFLVLYGSAGTGKSTVLNIIQKIFEGYYVAFDAKALSGVNNAFAMEMFRNNPLVAIQHDGDLSQILDNTKLNSIISHEEMTVNEKFKSAYTARFNAFLFMGTNQPVKITDAKSGIIRRLIDVHPTGKRVSMTKYQSLMAQINFELGQIANQCINIYRTLGSEYYNTYEPRAMMFQTDVFFNFVEDHFDIFSSENGIPLKRAFALYQQYCEDTRIPNVLPRYKFRDELRNYFKEFHNRKRVDGKDQRSYFEGFLKEKLLDVKPELSKPLSVVLNSDKDLLYLECADCPAQYAKEDGSPAKAWRNVETTLKDLDSSRLHYVQVPENHIVIDFDLKDEFGKKSAVKNLEAASKWPPTYSEFSKSGQGVHLHYIWDGGDPKDLAPVFDKDGIEVKVYTGNSSLRRKFTVSNGVPIATISSGLPLKEKETKVLDEKRMTSEKGVRDLITRNLRKEIHPGTKPSVDFIFKILEDAYESGVEYDVSDLRPAILAFAVNSTNQAEYCVRKVSKMKFKSHDITDFDGVESHLIPEASHDELVFFDVEVYPNLFYISWKFAGEDSELVHMFNPTPEAVGALLQMKLVGFNNRRYDNHILMARYLGYSTEEIFQLSQRIIDGDRENSHFGSAWNVSHADVYDFSSKKQSLKKWQVDLGIRHMELDIPWDEPVPEDEWEQVAEYCDNDVLATEAVFNARKQDYIARQILASLSGLSINDTTRSHTTKIIFGNNKNPQGSFNYKDLSEEFPGYEYDFGKSTYKGEITGEGGYVYAEPGIYHNVIVLDIASMHPTTIEVLELFGPYTEKFSELKDARIAIKHRDYKKASEYLDGAFEPYLKDEADATALSEALKIVINSVYGFTSAKFPNPFRDIRNVDNIVAKRGALFMIDLKEAVQAQGYTVAHIKTDSIKIPDADPHIIEFVKDFGKKYGYIFEVEDSFSKMCLVNDAVYVAETLSGGPDIPAKWKAVGAQFREPYVFKTLFSREPISFEDMSLMKSVKTSIFLDMNEDLPEGEHDYKFVGRIGVFCPVVPGAGGGILLRKSDDAFHAVTGTKGYRWLEANTVRYLKKEDMIDKSYFQKLVDEAIETIGQFGNVDEFING